MNAPVCPLCGAKFSHDPEKMVCRKCGLPDEVRDRGGHAIRKWRTELEQARPAFSLPKLPGQGGSISRKSKPHGRTRGRKVYKLKRGHLGADQESG